MGKIQRQPALNSRAVSLSLPESQLDPPPEAELQRINSTKHKKGIPQSSGSGSEAEPEDRHLEDSEHRLVYQFLSPSQSERRPMCRKFDADCTLQSVTTLMKSGCSVHMACKEVGVSRTTFYRLHKRSNIYENFLETTSAHQVPTDAKMHSNVADSTEKNQTTDSFPKPIELPSIHDSLLPGLNASNISMLPPRLKNHFMNLMHNCIKRHVSATKLWATMTELEQEDITRLSHDICSHPTLVSEPLTFMWEGTLITKFFPTYSFLQPCCLQLVIRYLRDRHYRHRQSRGGGSVSPLSDSLNIDTTDSGPAADIEHLSTDFTFDSSIRVDREPPPKASKLRQRRVTQEIKRGAGEVHAGLESDTPFFERWEQSKRKRISNSEFNL